MTAFDIQALYNKEMDQVTIWASLTEDTPRTVAALLADPRTDDDTGPAATADPARHLAAVHSGPGPMACDLTSAAADCPRSRSPEVSLWQRAAAAYHRVHRTQLRWRRWPWLPV